MRLFFDIPPDKRSDQEYVKKTMDRAGSDEREVIQRLMMNRKGMEERMIKDLAMAYDFLKSTYHPEKFGVVGFCLGGGLSFRISTHLPFDATVVYYGANPPNLEDIATLKGPMMGLYAGDDEGITTGLPDMIRSFVKYRKQVEMKLYPSVRHAFANNDSFAYNKEAAEDAWERASSFFRRYLQ